MTTRRPHTLFEPRRRSRTPSAELLEPRCLLCTIGEDLSGPADQQIHVYDAQGAHLDLQVSEPPDAGTIDRTAPFIGPQRATLQAGPIGGSALSTPAPTGGLNGKIVYVNAGHGWTYNGASWATQRPEYQELVEDLQTQDQITYYAQYLLNAGATVVPMRPMGHQLSELIVDNNDAGFSIEAGSWSTNSASSTYWSNQNGNDTGNRYRFANVSATETAVARFTPNIPTAGFYPVYAWWNNGSNRSTGVTYRINAAGGSQEVKVNQRYTGKGWVYLGSYYFDSGSTGNVEVSNKAADGSAIIADAVRFGNGMGTWQGDGSGPLSGKPKEEELSLYWLYLSRGWTDAGARVAQSTVDGGTASDSSAGINAPPRWSTYMNDQTQGTNTERVFLSIHSNGSSGLPDATARGTEALIHSTAPTINNAWFATTMGVEVEEDMQALPAGMLEHAWATRRDTASGEYGEMTNTIVNNEYSATMLEVAFHDNLQDSQLMRNPQVRNWVGRAAYHATAKYFTNFSGATATLAPDVPTAVRATTDAAGNVILNWTAPAADASTGGAGAATGYKILFGSSGYTWTDAVVLDNVTGHTFAPGTLPAGAMTYFKVVATNAGGESLQRDVVAAKPQAGRRAPILIVNGFDRIDRVSNDTTPWGGNNGITERVRLRYQNTRDYAVQFAEAVEAYNPALGVETVQNEHVINGTVNLANYHTVLWISGEESTIDDTFNATEQSLLTTNLAGGGKLFASDSEIGWDLDQGGAGAAFYNNQLRADFANDDANSYTTNGVAGSIFAGISSIDFDNGAGEGASGTYDVDLPDVLSPIGGSTAALTYSTGGTAAVQWGGVVSSAAVVTMGFPFETITTAAKRNAVMGAVLTFFNANGTFPSQTPAVPDLLASSDSGSSSSDNVTNHNHAGGRTVQFSVDNTVPGATIRIMIGGVELGSAVASGSTTLVALDSGVVLNDGIKSVKATQAEPGRSVAQSGILSMTVDTVAPVATFVPVAPDPRTNGVSSVAINFSRAVTGFNVSDLSLTLDANAVALTGSQAPTTSNNSSFVIANLSSLTSQSGAYALVLTAAGSGIIESLAGNALVADASDTWVHSLPAWLAAGSAATWNSATDTLTVSGAATIVADPLAELPAINADGPAAVLTINPAADLAVRVGALNLSNGATATVTSLGGARTAANHRVLRVLGGTLGIDAASTLDLTDNDLVLDYTGASPAADVEDMVRAGFHGGDWFGKRLTSSAAAQDNNFALAVVDNGLLPAPFGAAQGGPAFSGTDVDMTTVLVKFTHRIDLNLDGLVDPNDAAVFGTSFSENDAAFWAIGDVDFDGLFTPNDAAIFGTNYDESLGAV